MLTRSQQGACGKARTLFVSRTQTKYITFPFPCLKQKIEPLTPTPSRRRQRKIEGHDSTDSNPQSKETKENRNPLPHCFQPPVEGGRKADCILYWFQAQSKGTTCCPNGPSRKAQHAVPMVPIERHNMLSHWSQSKGTTCCPNGPN